MDFKPHSVAAESCSYMLPLSGVTNGPGPRLFGELPRLDKKLTIETLKKILSKISLWKKRGSPNNFCG